MTISAQIAEASLQEFLDESSEALERMLAGMHQLEGSQSNPEILASIYRDIHSMKGAAQIFGFAQIADLAHAMETSLELPRRAQQPLDEKLLTCLTEACDLLGHLIKGIRDSRQEVDCHRKVKLLISRLIEISSARITASHPLIPERPLVTQPVQISAAPQTAAFGFFEEESPVPPKAPNRKVERPVETMKAVPDESQSETIRVHVSLLDSLMNLVGEQVLIRNQLLQHARMHDEEDNALGKLSQRLNVLTAELQNKVMKTRMQPVGNVVNKFARVVRDISRDLGKKIELSIVGAETELDRTILEAIKDPLTHIVRNAIDHGIELPKEREEKGKPAVGNLKIKSYHESGQVIIEIRDDGRGLDPKRIGDKALEKGLVSSERLATMSERDIQSFIFAAGFSTASTVSSLSGRGVGMDVVKTNVERVGGIVDLESRVGTGTCIRLKIPLTLAIIPALIVTTLGQHFALPQNKLLELVLVDPENPGSERIEILQGSPVLRLRGRILPLLMLCDVLKAHGTRRNITDITGSPQNVVVLDADGFEFALVVDQIEDTADIVVKSLPTFMKEVPYYSGASIMGDGSIALTVDIMGLAKALQNNEDHQALRKLGALAEPATRVSDTADFLLVRLGKQENYAMPLSLVFRLEEFAASSIRYSGELKVVRYRDALLPIFSLSQFLQIPESTGAEAQEVPVVVIQRQGRLYGLEVGAICDVATLHPQIDQSIRDRPGVLGSMISGDNVIIVVDALKALDTMRARLAPDATPEPTAAGGKRILLVEDSSFFRNYIREVLQGRGYDVTAANDGREALDLLDQRDPDHFDLVLSDIEMPTMDGLTLARTLSSNHRYKFLPLVAITTRFSDRDIKDGLHSGFMRYMEKLNPEQLLHTIQELLTQEQQRKGA